MKTSTFLLLLGAALAVYLIGQSGQKKPAAPVSGSGGEGDAAPVVHLVEETLHQHEGEDNPIVHAFEEALAHQHADAKA